MCRRQSVDIRKGGSPGFANHVEEKKICNREVIQFFGHARMLANAIQRVTGDKERADAGVVKGLDAEMVPRAKQSSMIWIPKRKRKITAQVIDAGWAPGCVSVQNQIAVRRVQTHILIGALQLGDQFLACVKPRIRNDPVTPF